MTLRYISARPGASAPALVAEVFRQAAREFAVVPPLTLHTATPAILAALWCLSREAFVVGRAGRSLRETVAAAVSQASQCPYCVAVHSSMLHALDAHGLADALLRPGDGAGAHDPLVRWALRNEHAAPVFPHELPFPAAKIPALLATVVLFRYLNRMVNIFLDPSPLPMPSVTQHSRLGRLLARLAGATVGRRIVAVEAAPGRSLHLLPDAPLPPDLAFATPDAAIAGALARLNAAIAAQAQPILTPPVQTLLSECIARWDGSPPGIDRRWLENTVRTLGDPAQQAAARLVLLAAFASYRVEGSLVQDFRRHFPDDAQLIAVCAWGSFAAARRPLLRTGSKAPE